MLILQDFPGRPARQFSFFHGFLGSTPVVHYPIVFVLRKFLKLCLEWYV
jgi:hypothetical protein